MKLVAVVSCRLGIAYTYLAAEALETTGKAMGHEVFVEIQRAALPAPNARSALDRFYAGLAPVDPTTIASADGVIFASTRAVQDRERFAGKPTVEVGVERAAQDARGVIEQAVAAVEATSP